MTEDEAKKRKCFRDRSGNCIASECMAWRHDRFHDFRERQLWSLSRNKKVSSAFSDDADWRLVNPDEPIKPQTGTCGALKQ